MISSSVLFDGLRCGKCNMDFICYIVEEKNVDPCSIGNCSSSPNMDSPPIVFANSKQVPDEVFEYFLKKYTHPNFPTDFNAAHTIKAHPEAEQDVAILLGEAESEIFSLSRYFDDAKRNHATLLNTAISFEDEGKIELLLAHGTDPRYKGRGTLDAFDVLESYCVSLFIDEDFRSKIYIKLSDAILKFISADKFAP